MKKISILSDMNFIQIASTVESKNPTDVKTVGTEVQDPAIKPKQ